MLTISSKENTKLGGHKVTLFVVLRHGQYVCRCIAGGYNATDEQCLQAYQEQDDII